MKRLPGSMRRLAPPSPQNEHPASGTRRLRCLVQFTLPGALPATYNRRFVCEPALSGKYVVFDQSPFATGFGNGLSSEGLVYIPEACAKKDGCRLHIALHGCEQNRDEVGKAFIEGSGFARWADANRFVILFPQVSANPLLNPKGCWDWWGYTGEDYLTKDAPQIAAIWKMAERLAERPVTTESR